MILGISHPLKNPNSDTPTWYISAGIKFVADYRNLMSGYYANKTIFDTTKTEHLSSAKERFVEALRRKRVSGVEQTVVFSTNVGGHFATYAMNTRGEMMILNSLAGYDSDNTAKAIFLDVLREQGFKNPKVFQKVSLQGDAEKCGLVTLEMVSYIDPNKSFESQWDDVSKHFDQTTKTPYKKPDEKHQQNWLSANRLYEEQQRLMRSYKQKSKDELREEFLALLEPVIGNNVEYNIVNNDNSLEMVFNNSVECQRFANIFKNLIPCTAEPVGNKFILNKTHFINTFVSYPDKKQFFDNFNALIESRTVVGMEAAGIQGGPLNDNNATNTLGVNQDIAYREKQAQMAQHKQDRAQTHQAEFGAKKDELAQTRQSRLEGMGIKTSKLLKNTKKHMNSSESNPSKYELKQAELAQTRARRAKQKELAKTKAERKEKNDQGNPQGKSPKP